MNTIYAKDQEGSHLKIDADSIYYIEVIGILFK